MKNTLIILVFSISNAFTVLGQSEYKLNGNDQAIKNIERVFNNYVKNSESTETEDNKRIMTESLNTIRRVIRSTDLEVLINVWLYYDPTDYPSRDLVFMILKRSKEESLAAIKARKRNKKEWEVKDEAPFSELEYLYRKLDEK